MNGDGYDDIIVGAFRYDFNNVSHAYVWHGSKDGLGLAGNTRPEGLPSNADWTASNPTGDTSGVGGNSFGTSVGTAGDVNGDGYADVFVGAPTYDNGEIDEGMVFVWHGSNTGLGPDGTTGNADWVAQGDQAGAKLSGQPLSNETCGARTAGDVNGDGYDDFLIGAYQYDNGSSDEGAAFLWLGSSLGLNGGVDGNPGNAAWQAESNLDTGWLGQELAGGDINGDGFNDIIVGSIYFDRTNPTVLANAGAVMAWFGSDTGMGPDGNPDNADWIAFGDQANTHFAWALSSAGDVNGDHLDDILIGADYYDNPESNEGRAFVYHGQPEAIQGLSAHNDGPTTLGAATTFSSTVSAGTWITYSWDLGDDLIKAGRVVTHTYSFPGVYTATVMASNSVGFAYASTQITVVDPMKHIYLPAIFLAP